MIDVVLQPGRDRSVRRRHPWLLSGSVARIEGAPGASGDPGAAGALDLARVHSAEGEVLAHGLLAPQARIRLRLIAFGKEPPEEDWLEQRIAAAVARRRDDPALARTDALRLLNAEGDFLPGLTADRYADCVVVRLGCAAMALRRERIADALREATGLAAGFERADSRAARSEGFEARQGPLWGAAPTSPVTIHEGERHYEVDLVAGQKTGFYLDQRELREQLQQRAAGRRVLDLFAYTGGFAVAAARGGAAAVTVVESSASATALARRNLALNGAREPRVVEGDVSRFLREDSGPYDFILLDPPPLARRRADLARASRAYKDLLLRALSLAAPGAELYSFRCSAAMDATLFRQIAFGASLDAGRPLQVLGAFAAPTDHPVALDHPEGDYFGGLWLRA